MNRVDFLLNLAGLLLWLEWRAVRLGAPLAAAGSISAVLKHAKPRAARRWLYLAALVALLGIRCVFYWRVGSRLDWVPSLDLGTITLPFNSVSLGRMALYSVLSFGVVLAVFHLWLLLLSMVNRRVPDTDPWQRLVRQYLGWLEPWPVAVKLAAPIFLVGALWWFAHAELVRQGMTAAPGSAAHLAQQSILVGLGTILAWKYLVIGLLFLGLLNTYLYLGSWSVWAFVQTTSRNLLRPLHLIPLRLGRIDLLPAVGLGLAWLAFAYAEAGISHLFGRLPL
ncbi:MAG TPA: hypothetical protein PKM43_16610 [Verrucomicrobiota bacterium]|nr:hypothetical protein [Verrucomicrobiota bacterium]